MDPDRWRRIEDVYQSAAERKVEEQDALLAAAFCDVLGPRRKVGWLFAQDC